MKIMQLIKTGFVFILFAIFVYVVPTQVLAHTLESSGSIGAVLHVTPDDDPIAGEVSGFYFEFKDKNNKFQPENCVCTVSIKKGDDEIFSTDLFGANSDPSLSNASFNFTFPEKNIYKIVINGEPKISGEFQSFQLSYDLRVERISEKVSSTIQDSQDTSSKKLPIVPLSMAGFLVICGGLYIIFKKKK